MALILVDARSEAAPLAGVGHWARALRHAQLAGGGASIPSFLVAARTDRGGLAVSDERLAAVVAEHGFAGYFATSAKAGVGIAELHAAVLAAIDWSRIPSVTSTATLRSREAVRS